MNASITCSDTTIYAIASTSDAIDTSHTEKQRRKTYTYSGDVNPKFFTSLFISTDSQSIGYRVAPIDPVPNLITDA